MLSEYAVLGFEYGYSLAEPNALTLGKRSSAISPMARRSCSTSSSVGRKQMVAHVGPGCLLPHGFEGQGPEHSSARLERFLQMCGQDNWIVANCTTPANYFHILRRQLHRSFRKPLILMTPKSLLRHKLAVSKAEEFTTGSSFHRVLWDDANTAIRTRNWCRRQDQTRRDVFGQGLLSTCWKSVTRAALTMSTCMRFEQFYPFPANSRSRSWNASRTPKWSGVRKSPRTKGLDLYGTNIEWVLSRIKANISRPSLPVAARASPATGLASNTKHNKQHS